MTLEDDLKTLNVDINVWEVLQTIKIEKRLSRMNDVIKLILSKYKE